MGSARQWATAFATVVSVLVPIATLTIAIGPTAAHAKVAGAVGRIAFARDDAALQDTVTYTANADGSDMRQLYPGASGSPHWSPNGQLIAIAACADPPVCDTAAVIVDPNTGAAARTLPMTDANDLFTSCVIWSPDGATLACEGIGQIDPTFTGVYTISATDGGDLTRITTNASGDDLPLDYSPAGNQIVISRTDSTRPATSNSALFVITLGSGHSQRITPWGFYDNEASWSPDGSQIAFEHHGKIFTVHPDGTDLSQLPLAVHGSYFAGDPSWSPAGTRLLFLLGGNNRQEGIATANRDGSDVRQATVSPTRDHEGDWG